MLYCLVLHVKEQLGLKAVALVSYKLLSSLRKTPSLAVRSPSVDYGSVLEESCSQAWPRMQLGKERYRVQGAQVEADSKVKSREVQGT